MAISHKSGGTQIYVGLEEMSRSKVHQSHEKTLPPKKCIQIVLIIM
jgi:hypothetical protein